MFVKIITQDNCPLNGDCLTHNVIYPVTMKTDNSSNMMYTFDLLRELGKQIFQIIWPSRKGPKNSKIYGNNRTNTNERKWIKMS